MLEIGPDPGHGTDFDVQVIGSDEVFNCVQSNTNVGYSRDLFGFDRWRGRSSRTRVRSATRPLERIDAAGLRCELEQGLGRFSAVSVRDRNSAEIAHALTWTIPEVHVDPVLAFDYVNSEPRIPRVRMSKDRYVLVYGYSGRFDVDENDAIRRHARDIGARVFSLGGVQGCADRFVDCDPFELLAYFRDAAAVITDTFHGTTFSIINHVPFATIVRPTRHDGYGNEEKLGFLLESWALDLYVWPTLRTWDECSTCQWMSTRSTSILERERARNSRLPDPRDRVEMCVTRMLAGERGLAWKRLKSVLESPYGR